MKRLINKFGVILKILRSVTVPARSLAIFPLRLGGAMVVVILTP
jgi:hypothetical protein